jgi:hypothetical protein
MHIKQNLKNLDFSTNPQTGLSGKPLGVAAWHTHPGRYKDPVVMPGWRPMATYPECDAHLWNSKNIEKMPGSKQRRHAIINTQKSTRSEPGAHGSIDITCERMLESRAVLPVPVRSFF